MLGRLVPPPAKNPVQALPRGQKTLDLLLVVRWRPCSGAYRIKRYTSLGKALVVYKGLGEAVVPNTKYYSRLLSLVLAGAAMLACACGGRSSPSGAGSGSSNTSLTPAAAITLPTLLSDMAQSGLSSGSGIIYFAADSASASLNWDGSQAPLSLVACLPSDSSPLPGSGYDGKCVVPSRNQVLLYTINIPAAGTYVMSVRMTAGITQDVNLSYPPAYTATVNPLLPEVAIGIPSSPSFKTETMPSPWVFNFRTPGQYTVEARFRTMGDTTMNVEGFSISPAPPMPTQTTVSSAQLPCDVATCAVAFSTTRALRSSYAGRLIQLQRSSDNAVQDIGQVGGVIDTAAVQSFCGSSTCYYTAIYDQIGRFNLITSQIFGPSVPVMQWLQLPNGKVLPTFTNGDLQAGGRAYGLNPRPPGYPSGTGPMPTGQMPFSEYAVTVGGIPSVCCFDFGESEDPIGQYTSNPANAWSLVAGGGIDSDSNNIPDTDSTLAALNDFPLTTTLTKSNGVSHFVYKAGNAEGGPLASTGAIPLNDSTVGTVPMDLEGGLTLGNGGDGSGTSRPSPLRPWRKNISAVLKLFHIACCNTETQDRGVFFEGVVFGSETSDATDNAIQLSINNFYGP
jgi:hypothetical protein